MSYLSPRLNQFNHEVHDNAVMFLYSFLLFMGLFWMQVFNLNARCSRRTAARS